ncbi:MAG: PAS domain-containing protein, partial [Deltaproteobacteria bacterium]|nr:PAS domain-containing protein [Deltaproteobacteria bacterium]
VYTSLFIYRFFIGFHYAQWFWEISHKYTLRGMEERLSMDGIDNQSAGRSTCPEEKELTDELMNLPDNGIIIDGLGFRSIIDLLPAYLSIQDHSMHILFANQTFKYDFGEGIGKLCHEVYKGSPEKCKDCPVQKTFNDKKVHISEETVQLSTGEMADMIVYSSPLEDTSGNVVAVIEMSTNITKIKEMQKELKNLGQSIAILSHDIKNILEGLQGGAYVVDEGIKDGDMDISLKYETNQALPFVKLDPLSIRRMLENFIWNALEACKKDKAKHFHTVVVRADFHDRFHLKFEVEDDGVGMDEKTRANIFDEFYSTKGSDGTGLGLLVADRVIKEHRGKVDILTAQGKGSTFRVIFKLH